MAAPLVDYLRLKIEYFMIKVLLADDHSIVRAGLRRIVEDSGDMKAIVEATDGREAIE